MFKAAVEQKYLILATSPTKVVRNKEGVPVEIYDRENSEMRALLWAGMQYNGGIWMPEVHLKIFENKTTPKPILYKSVFMSKKEYAAAGLTKTSTDEKKIPVYKEYIKKHKEKYRNQITQLFREADRELEALQKHEVPEGGSSLSPEISSLIKDFIFNPNQKHTKDLLLDMKDKGYIRPMLRGERKGQLLTDMKAINRVALNYKLRYSPTGISALIAKDLADKLLKWTRWGFSISLLTDIDLWAKKVSEMFNLSGKEKERFRSQAHKAVEYYSKEIYDIVMAFNEKRKENPDAKELSLF